MTNKNKISVIFLLISIFYFYIGSYSLAQDSQPITSPRCNEFTFDATSSYDPENENLKFLWDLGDGTTSHEPIVHHQYKKSGQYKVTLTVTDNSGLECSQSVTSQTVYSNLPPQALFTAPGSTCNNQPVTLDGSASYDEDNNPLTYTWDFGDGTSQEGAKRVTKNFLKGGDYKVALTVSDKSNSNCQMSNLIKTIRVNEPPKAEIGQEEILKCLENENEDITISFDASQTTDINNDPISYVWDFGDGSRAEEKEATHTFSKIGNYDVKLITKDNSSSGCGVGVDFVSVKINVAPKAEAGEDMVSCVGDEILFDGSNSYSYKKGTLLAKWDFGDGQSKEGLKVTHSYPSAGQYQATLAVENSLNQACQASKDVRNITVNARPTVSLKEQEKICLGTKVHFDAYSASDPDGDTLEYYWTLGDGTVLKGGPNISHEYKQGGDYRVSVIIDDGRKTPCSTATAYTLLKVNTPPQADAGTNLICCANKEAEFNASSSSDLDGDKLSYVWDFGDGVKKEGPTAKHAYTKTGSYNVTLTVDDNSGTPCSSSTSGFTATVNSTPTAVINVR